MHVEQPSLSEIADLVATGMRRPTNDELVVFVTDLALEQDWQRSEVRTLLDSVVKLCSDNLNVVGLPWRFARFVMNDSACGLAPLFSEEARESEDPTYLQAHAVYKLALQAQACEVSAETVLERAGEALNMTTRELRAESSRQGADQVRVNRLAQLSRALKLIARRFYGRPLLHEIFLLVLVLQQDEPSRTRFATAALSEVYTILCEERIN